MPPTNTKNGRLNSKRSARDVLATELARLRALAGWTLADLSDKVMYDRAYLHKLETGVRLGSPEVIAALDTVYATGQHIADMWDLARQDAFRDKFKRFMDLEAKATMRYEYACATVPGLLQTEDYAREQLRVGRPRDEDELEEQVAARLGRQRLLNGDNPVEFRAVLDETVLRRRLSDPVAWERQLQHLLEASKRPNITLQVLPFSAGVQDLLGGSLTILWLPDGTSTAYTEGAYSGDLVEDPADVEQYRLAYDLLRDSSLSPRDSVALILNFLEASTPCASPDPS